MQLSERSAFVGMPKARCMAVAVPGIFVNPCTLRGRYISESAVASSIEKHQIRWSVRHESLLFLDCRESDPVLPPIEGDDSSLGAFVSGTKADTCSG